MKSHGHHVGTHHRGRSGRDNLFYLYEERNCFCNGVPCTCPDTGALDAAGNQKPNTLEKRSPLPAGRYWVDVFGKNIPAADAWFKAMSGLGVHVDATQVTPDEDPNRTLNWYLFTYAPTGGVLIVWDKSLGYPTIAGANIKSQSDTIQAPDLPLNPLDELSNWMNKLESELGGSIGGAAKVVPYVVLGGLGLAGFLLLKEFGIIRKAKKYVSSRTRINRTPRSG